MALRLLQAAEMLETHPRYTPSTSLGAESDPDELHDFEVPSMLPPTRYHHAASPEPYQPHNTYNQSFTDQSESEGEAEEEEEEEKYVAPREVVPESAAGNLSHNSVEKQRRAFLASCYTTLKAEVPAVRGVKASNATVLQRAADFIKDLCEEETTLLDEIRHQKQIYQDRSAALKKYVAATPSGGFKRKAAPANSPPVKRPRRDACDNRSVPLVAMETSPCPVVLEALRSTDSAALLKPQPRPIDTAEEDQTAPFGSSEALIGLMMLSTWASEGSAAIRGEHPAQPSLSRILITGGSI